MPLKDIVNSWGLRGIRPPLSVNGILQLFEPFSVKMGGEVVDHFIEVAFEHLFELMQGETGPVVRDPVLGEVIGPDPLRPVS
jgi:hypothetical protein